MIGVTGATGFIGGALCKELLRRGFKVKALVRSPQKAGALQHEHLELVPGNLSDRASLEHLVSDCAAVIHGAGAVRGSRQEDFNKVNVDGTVAIISAIKSQPSPPRLVLLSSLAAREPQLSWYASSKRAGEDLLRHEDALDWVVLRPPAVYGPGDKEMLPVFQMMARGVATVAGDSNSRMSLVHVTDLINAIIACLEGEAVKHQIFYPTDGRPGGYDWHEMADIAGATWSRKVRLWHIPHWLLDGVAAANLRIARWWGRSPMLTPPKLRELRHPNWVADHEELCKAVAWTPEIDLAEGLRQLRESAL